MLLYVCICICLDIFAWGMCHSSHTVLQLLCVLGCFYAELELYKPLSTASAIVHHNVLNQPTRVYPEVLRILLRLAGRYSRTNVPCCLSSIFNSAQTLWLLRQMPGKPWVTSHFLSPENSSYALKIELKMCPTLAGCQTGWVRECAMEMKDWQSWILLLQLCRRTVLCSYMHAE